MDPKLLRAFCDLVQEKAGISLNESKAPLLVARLARRLRALGLSHEREYLEVLRNDEAGEELVHFLDAISTNFTSFFREADHFEQLAAQVATWLAEGRRKFRFWSVASSSGEEPYTMALVVEEALAGCEVDYKILGTDISTRVLGLARAATYSEARVEPVPRHLRNRYFTRHPGRAGGADMFEVNPALRCRASFARLNLAAPPFPMTGPMDIVFCRNVMIYFDQRVRQALVTEIERLLAPGGLLMIGHSETLTGISTGLRSLRSSTYQKPGPRDRVSARPSRVGAGR